jgi:hypothetical protein
VEIECFVLLKSKVPEGKSAFDSFGDGLDLIAQRHGTILLDIPSYVRLV